MTKKTKEAKLQRHRTDKIIRRQKDPNEIQKGQKVTQCGKRHKMTNDTQKETDAK